jgi:hypothetical protein
VFNFLRKQDNVINQIVDLVLKHIMKSIGSTCNMKTHLMTGTQPVSYSEPGQPRINVRVLCSRPLLVSWAYLRSLFENREAIHKNRPMQFTRSKAAAPSLEKRTLDAIPPCGLTMTVAED